MPWAKGHVNYLSTFPTPISPKLQPRGKGHLLHDHGLKCCPSSGQKTFTSSRDDVKNTKNEENTQFIRWVCLVTKVRPQKSISCWLYFSFNITVSLLLTEQRTSQTHPRIDRTVQDSHCYTLAQGYRVTVMPGVERKEWTYQSETQLIPLKDRE